MTKEELKRIPEIIKLIKIKEKQLEELSEISVCVPTLNTNEKVQSSVVNKGMPICDKKIDLERKLLKDKEILIEKRNEALNLIQRLQGVERRLMELRYISGFKWEEIAIEMNYTYRHTTRLHGKILKKIFPKN